MTNIKRERLLQDDDDDDDDFQVMFDEQDAKRGHIVDAITCRTEMRLRICSHPYFPLRSICLNSLQGMS